MNVGDLVRFQPGTATPLVEGDWIGIITGFRIDADLSHLDYRYALVFWNERYPEEEEHLESLEVIDETR